MKEVTFADLYKEISSLEKEKEDLQGQLCGKQELVEMLSEKAEKFDNLKKKAFDYEHKIVELQEQCSTRYEVIERLNGEKKQLQEDIESQKQKIYDLQTVVNIKTAAIDSLQEENKKLLEKLDVAEKELEKEIRTLEMESDARAFAQRQYEEIKLKNQNICSSIADLVRKVMQE